MTASYVGAAPGATAVSNIVVNNGWVNAEIALVHYLRGKYKGPKFLRPVHDAKDAFPVTVGLNVGKLTINEEDGMATVTCYVFSKWNNYNLTWNPKDFGGVKVVRLPTSEFWMPDISLVQSGFGFQVAGDKGDDINACVSHEGHVMHIPIRVFTVQAIPVSPGHYQITLSLGSWTYDNSRIDLRVTDPKGVGLEYFDEGPKWSVTSGGVTVTPHPFPFDFFPGFDEKFPSAHYTIDVKKKV